MLIPGPSLIQYTGPVWARVTGTTSVGTTSLTALAFNAEDTDTDNIHDNAVNNSRLTCRTPWASVFTTYLLAVGDYVRVLAIHNNVGTVSVQASFGMFLVK